jgi:hypothetical protein
VDEQTFDDVERAAAVEGNLLTNVAICPLTQYGRSTYITPLSPKRVLSND